MEKLLGGAAAPEHPDGLDEVFQAMTFCLTI